MRPHIYPERSAFPSGPPRQHDLTRADLNEVQVIKRLVSRGSELDVVLLSGETVSGPVVWADIHNIAIEVAGKVRVIMKASAETWAYAKSDAH